MELIKQDLVQNFNKIINHYKERDIFALRLIIWLWGQLVNVCFSLIVDKNSYFFEYYRMGPKLKKKGLHIASDFTF